MSEKLNIETATTAGESPFSKGTAERQNKTLMVAMEKTTRDVKCEQDIASAWAVSAKMLFQTQAVLSPNQLVFGCIVNTPTVLKTSSMSWYQPRAMVSFRRTWKPFTKPKNFVPSEAIQKVCQPLCHKV